MYIRLSNDELKQAVYEFIQKRFNEAVELNSLVIKSPRTSEGYYAEIDITLKHIEKSSSIGEFIDEATTSIVDKGKELADVITKQFTSKSEPSNEEIEDEEEEPFTQPSPTYDDTGSEDEEEDAIDKLINKKR